MTRHDLLTAAPGPRGGLRLNVYCPTGYYLTAYDADLGPCCRDAGAFYANATFPAAPAWRTHWLAFPGERPDRVRIILASSAGPDTGARLTVVRGIDELSAVALPPSPPHRWYRWVSWAPRFGGSRHWHPDLLRP